MSWGEFLSVWVPVCIILDVVFIFTSRSNNAAKQSIAEERKAKTKQLYTPFVDGESYKSEIKPLSMKTVEVLKPSENIRKKDESNLGEEQEFQHTYVEGNEIPEDDDMTEEQAKNTSFALAAQRMMSK